MPPIRSLRAIAALTVLLCVAAAGLYGWQLLQGSQRLHDQTVDRAMQRTRQLAEVAAHQLLTLTQTLDHAADELAQVYASGGTPSLAGELTQLSRLLPEGALLQAGVIDAHGRLAYSNLGGTPGVDLSDREHFKAHLGSGADRLFIAAPVLGRVSQQWSIQFTRPIRRQGQFAGVMVLSVAQAYLQHSLSGLTLSPGDDISVLRRDGQVLAGTRDAGASIGRLIGGPRPFVASPAEPRGSYRTADSPAHPAHFNAWQRVGEYPLLVHVAVAEAPVLAPVEQQLQRDRRNALLAIVVVTLLGAAVVWLLRRVGQQQVLEQSHARQLQAGEQRYRSLVEHLDEVVFRIDRKGRWSFLNPAWERCTGYPAADQLGHNVLDIVHPDDRELADRHFRDLVHGQGGPVRFELRMQHRDGSERRVSVYATALPPTDGAAGGEVSGTFVDVTETRRQQAALERQAGQLASIIEGTHVGTWDWQIDTGVVEFNPRWAEIVGYTLPELQPTSIRTWQALAHPDDLALSSRLLQRHFDGELPAYECEARMRHKEGHWVWVLDRGKVIARGPDGRPLRMAGTHQDITDRKRAEAELQLHRENLQDLVERRTRDLLAQQAELRLILNAIPGVVSRWDKDLVCRFANPVYGNWIDLLPEQLVGRRVEEIFGDARIREIRPYLDAALRGERQQFMRRFPMPGQPGRLRHVEMHFVPYVEDGQVAGFYAMGFDVSELSAAKEQAEAANVAKSAFLANMSHEIRTPLNAIIGLTYLLGRSGVTEAQAERLQKIDTAGHHLLEVLNAVLDLSKIEAGKLELDRRPVRPGSVIDNVVAMLQDRAASKGLVLRTEVGPMPAGRWLGDAVRIQQALINYVGNAIKFASRGAITLRVRAEPAGTDLLTLRLEVEDQGEGIPAEQLGRLFRPFQQLDMSVTREHGGTGLGLAITRRLAEAMGGQAGATSVPGQGSTFWFTALLQRGAPAGDGPVDWVSTETVTDAPRASTEGAPTIAA